MLYDDFASGSPLMSGYLKVENELCWRKTGVNRPHAPECHGEALKQTLKLVILPRFAADSD
jgi:hypothetical protein